MKDIFKIIVSPEKLNKKFKLLLESDLFDPAKNIIKNIADLMNDKDGNFIEQFQSDGFDARLWELYLYVFFKENDFEFIDDVDRPDFHIRRDNLDMFVEASLSSEKKDDIFSKEFIQESMAKKDLAVQTQLIEYYIMRMGSVLFSKLNKKYWELDWVKGKPLIFAIAPSHNFLANFLPDAKIIEYLYGIKKIVRVTDTGIEHVKDEIVTEHRFNEKVIPANFFSQPHTENISAVIFTNNSDIHKFNRMGFQANLTSKNLGMFRSGYKYDETPGAPAQEFSYYVIPKQGIENWCESTSIFHNPNAKIKIDKSIFKHVRQFWLEENNKFGGIMTNDFVYHSITGVLGAG